MKKNITLYLILAVLFIGCQTEEISTIEENASSLDSGADIEDQPNDDLSPSEIQNIDFEEIQQSILNQIEGLDLEGVEGLDIISTADLNSGAIPTTFGKHGKKRRPRLTSICLVKDADRCPFGDSQPVSNMWWPPNELDFFNPSAYFSSTRRLRMIFLTFDNGTALIRGINSMNEGSCKVFVNVWLKKRKTYEEFTALGGEFRREPGCASQLAVPEDIVYYDLDASRSTITAWGDDCLGTGTFGLELRGDNRPSDPSTESAKLRAQLGPNGAAFDSNEGALGFSTWAFVTDRYTGERLQVLDFDFRLWCRTF